MILYLLKVITASDVVKIVFLYSIKLLFKHKPFVDIFNRTFAVVNSVIVKNV